VEFGRRDCVPNHGRRGDDDYWLKFSTALPPMFRRGICAERDSVSSSYPMQSIELPVVMLFPYVCFLPPSVYGKVCKQCIFMVLKIFIKCGDIDLLKTYDNENVLGVSNHDLKNILDLWFSVGFPI
jgi:hypothetical protein